MMLEKSKRPLNQDAIKYLAMFTMACNHFANALMNNGTVFFEVLINIGYFTAVTMCYFLVEGFGYTRSKKNYIIRLFMFAVISQVPYTLALGTYRLNMLFTLLICFIILMILDKPQHEMLDYVGIIMLVLSTGYADWPYLAPIFTICFYLAKGVVKKEALAFGINICFYTVWNLRNYIQMYPIEKALLHSFYTIIGMLVSAILILLFYNGKRAVRGRIFSKWFFYAFYPVHLAILAVLKILFVS